MLVVEPQLKIPKIVSQNFGVNFLRAQLNQIFEMTNKFSQAMQEKFMKDLDNYEAGDDSDDQSSLGDSFFETEKKRMHQAMQLLQNKKDNKVLNTLKENTAQEDTEIQRYQQQIGQLQQLTRNNEQNVIEESVIKEIKQRVFNQSMMNVVQLADQAIELQNKKQQEKEKEAREFSKKSHPFSRKEDEEQKMIERKLERAMEEREMVAMQREDQLSMKYQMQVLSQFFKERFYVPNIKIPEQKDCKVAIKSLTPKPTFTNLRPLPNNENNVLPKNSPQIAMRNLKKQKKIKLASSSMSEMKIKLKKINPEKQEADEEKLQLDKENGKENIQGRNLCQTLHSYIGRMEPMIKQITSLASSYKPTFVNKFPNQSEQNCNIDTDESQIKSIGSCLETEVPQSLKDIKLTFQKITNLDGIEKFIKIEKAALQYNNIRSLVGIEHCRKLIQLNISQNKVKDIGCLKHLKWLRNLNVEKNEIESLDLDGGQLEFLYASNNKIEEIVDLSNNPYLKKLFISHNKLHKLGGLSKQYFLQEIDVSYNYLQNLKGIHHCISLRILNASTNRLTQLYPNFIYFFLNKLTLSNNYLAELPDLILPSLEELYLDRNKIQNQSKEIIYLPNLKLLNLDNNKLTGFAPVWSVLRFSHKLETLKYDGNQYFEEVRDKVRELYEHIIYKNMHKLRILNQQPYDLGRKKYFEGAYNCYLASNTIFQHDSDQLRHIQAKINDVIGQQTSISNLEEKDGKFCHTDAFITHKSIKKSEDLVQINEFFERGSNSSNHQIFHGFRSIFFQHDHYEQRMRQSTQKVKGLICKNIRYLRNKKKFYQSNRPRLIQLFEELNQELKNRRINHILALFHKPLEGMSEEQAAIIIQKNYRCYRQRRRYLKVVAKLRVKDDDSDLSDFDPADYDFDNMEIPQFNFEVPEEYEFDQYIIKPEVFEIMKKNQQARTEKLHNNSGVNNGNPQPLQNNFMGENQSGMSERVDPRRMQEQQLEKLMRQWGVNRQAAKALLANKKQKEMKKKKEAEKNMTAAQRYQKFKRGHN